MMVKFLTHQESPCYKGRQRKDAGRVAGNKKPRLVGRGSVLVVGKSEPAFYQIVEVQALLWA